MPPKKANVLAGGSSTASVARKRLRGRDLDESPSLPSTSTVPDDETAAVMAFVQRSAEHRPGPSLVVPNEYSLPGSSMGNNSPPTNASSMPNPFLFAQSFACGRQATYFGRIAYGCLLTLHLQSAQEKQHPSDHASAGGSFSLRCLLESRSLESISSAGGTLQVPTMVDIATVCQLFPQQLQLLRSGGLHVEPQPVGQDEHFHSSSHYYYLSATGGSREGLPTMEKMIQEAGSRLPELLLRGSSGSPPQPGSAAPAAVAATKPPLPPAVTAAVPAPSAEARKPSAGSTSARKNAKAPKKQDLSVETLVPKDLLPFLSRERAAELAERISTSNGEPQKQFAQPTAKMAADPAPKVSTADAFALLTDDRMKRQLAARLGYIFGLLKTLVRSNEKALWGGALRPSLTHVVPLRCDVAIDHIRRFSSLLVHRQSPDEVDRDVARLVDILELAKSDVESVVSSVTSGNARPPPRPQRQKDVLLVDLSMGANAVEEAAREFLQRL
jgi:hypothetical protein